MAPAGLNQGSSNVESLSVGEVEPLGSEGAPPGVDIDPATPENKDVGDPWVIDQGRQRTQSPPGLSANASQARGGDQPGNTRHLLSVTGRPVRRGDWVWTCGKPPFLSSSPLF